MERYERLSLAKTRKNAEVDKQTVAAALLALSKMAMESFSLSHARDAIARIECD